MERPARRSVKLLAAEAIIAPSVKILSASKRIGFLPKI
jgi:hypothetical protein